MTDAGYGDLDGNDCVCRVCGVPYRYAESPEYCPACGQRDTDPQFGEEERLPISILQLAEYRLGRPATNGEDYEQAQLPMLGGCGGCHSTIACYNAYPSKTGMLRCADCIGDLGWDDPAAAAREIFGREEYTVVSRDGKFTMPASYQDEAILAANAASRGAGAYQTGEPIGFDVFRPGTEGPIYTAWSR